MNWKIAAMLRPPQAYLDGLTLEELRREEEDASIALDWASEEFNVGTKAREFYEDSWRTLEAMIHNREASSRLP